MKTVFIILFSVASIAVNAQDSKKSIKVDSAKEVLTDSTLLFSIRDLKPLYNELKALHETQPEKYKAYVESLTNPIVLYMDALIRQKAAAFKPKKQ